MKISGPHEAKTTGNQYYSTDFKLFTQGGDMKIHLISSTKVFRLNFKIQFT